MTEDESNITDTIFSLLNARTNGATICPSEVARSLAPGLWRPLMPDIREVARALARDERLEIRQHGVVLAPDAAFRGPIRLALPGSNANGEPVGDVEPG